MGKIEYAVSLIKKYHFHKKRKSGEPYYMHPINVALIILDIIQDEETNIFNELNKNKEDLIIAALLHDILEDTAYSKSALTKNFGSKARDLVLAVTKINHSNRAAILSNKQAFQNLIDKKIIYQYALNSQIACTTSKQSMVTQKLKKEKRSLKKLWIFLCLLQKSLAWKS